MNVNLKEQLEESHSANETLTNDLQKLSNEWDSLREEMTVKEEEWKEEELAFNEYYMSEHNRLMNLKKEVVSVKRLYSETKFATERDLSKLRSEMSNMANEIVMACSSASFSLKMQAAASSSMVGQKDFGQVSTDEFKKPEYNALRERLEIVQNDVRSKDDRIHQLMREVST